MDRFTPSTWWVPPPPGVERKPGHLSVLDVIDRVLDKGIIIDASVRISLVGIDLISVDIRVVVASIETYVRHADVLSFLPHAGGPAAARPARPRRTALPRAA